MKKIIKSENYFKELNRVIGLLNYDKIDFLADLVDKTIREGNSIFTCGNGGSAQTASHLITDWAKMFNLAHKLPAKVFSLVDNKGLVTAYGNDLDYSEIFSGQLDCYASNKDLLITVSGSGNSPNIIKALEKANQLNMNSFSILGYDGGKAVHLSKDAFVVPSFDMQICEDIHMSVCHIVMKRICKTPIT